MRILKRAFSLFLLLSFAAMTGGFAQVSEPATPASPGENAIVPEYTEENALTDLESVYLSLVDGAYDDVIGRLDDSVRSMLTADALATGYASEIGPLGAFVEIANKRAASANGAITAVLVAQHEAGQAQLTCVFSPQGTITGIGIAKVSAAAEAAEPLPLELSEGAEERPVTLHAGTEKELTGALVLPKGADQNTPVVIVAHGSGVSDLDSTVGPNKLFRDIAYGLAKRGIASLRYDKLHYAHPELATADLTADDEYTDTVLEALAVARSEADLGAAYLLGHSEGGMLTPYLMKNSKHGFAGGIILAGTPRKLWDLMVDQSIAMMEGMPEETIAAAIAQMDGEREKLATLDAMTEDELREAVVCNMPGPYVAHLNQIDPIALAIENDAPLLILQGEEDFQVYFDVDFALWRDGLQPMGDRVTYRSYPGLSHLFMPAHGSIHDAMEAYSIPSFVDETVIADIADWIEKQG